MSEQPPPPSDDELEEAMVLPESVPPDASNFYRLDSTNISFREFFFETKNPLVLGIAIPLIKVFRVNLGGSTDDPCVEQLATFDVDCESMQTNEAAEHFAPLLAELQAIGFQPVSAQSIDDLFHRTRTHLLTLRAADGFSWARLHLRRHAIRQPPRIKVFCEFLSEQRDGMVFWSRNGKPDMLTPPQWHDNRITKASVSELWKSHHALVSTPRVHAALVRFADGEAVRESTRRHHEALCDFNVKRGVFKKYRAKDIEQLSNLRQAVAQGRPLSALDRMNNGSDDDVLAELARQQSKKTGWIGTIMVLLLSLALFVGIGKSAWSWRLLWMLVPILFIHELGHYLAMRAFGYRNLRMLFIPLFGAAVTGRHYNAPGWKRVIVALAGPVPSIIIAALLGAAAGILHRPLLVEFSMLMLIINAFNLIPILPLDGGHVVQTLLFSRHHLLDVLFRALAGAGVIAGGFFLQDRFLQVVGIFMLIGLPAAYKVARIASEMRGAALPEPMDSAGVPTPWAQAILAKLRAAFPRGRPVQTLATYTLTIYETVHARPPGVLGTLGLGVAHIGAAAIAITFAVVLAVSGAGFPGRFNFDFDRNLIAHDRASLKEIAGTASETSAESPTIVAKFASAKKASAALESLEAPTGSRVVLMDRIILIRVPDDAASSERGRVLDHLEKAAGQDSRENRVFVASKSAPAAVTIVATAASESAASGLADKITPYLSYSSRYPADWVAPWSQNDTRPGEQRARAERAQRTLAALNRAAFPKVNIEEVLRTENEDGGRGERMEAARRRGDSATVKRLQKEAVDESRRQLAQRVESVVAQPDLDQRVVELFRRMHLRDLDETDDSPDKYKNWLAESERDNDVMSQLLAGVEAPRATTLPTTQMTPSAKGYDGTAFADKESLRIHLLTCADLMNTPLEIMDWLSTAGCKDIRYDFGMGYDRAMDD